MAQHVYVEEGVPGVGYDFTGDLHHPAKMVKVFNGREVEDFFNAFQDKKIRMTVKVLEECEEQ